MRNHTAYVGRTDAGARVYLDLALSPLQHPERVVRFDHRRPTDEELTRHEFSASAFVIEKGHRHASRAGQCLDELLEVTEPAAGWTTYDLGLVHRLWKRWHLNAMRAACVHMDVEQLVRAETTFGSHIVAGPVNPCPAGDDYFYGKGWLYEPLPGWVEAEVRRLMTLPTGRVPSTY